MTTAVDNPTLAAALETLRRHASEWQAHKIRHVWIVGSVARGDHWRDSDLDILFEMERPFSLFDAGGAWSYFESLFGSGIDVLEKSCIRPEIRQSVLEDAVLAA